MLEYRCIERGLVTTATKPEHQGRVGKIHQQTVAWSWDVEYTAQCGQVRRGDKLWNWMRRFNVFETKNIWLKFTRPLALWVLFPPEGADS